MNITSTSKLPIHIVPHHLSLSDALAEFVRTKVTGLLRIAGDTLAADIVLRRHHGTTGGSRFSASGRLSVPGKDIHATAQHEDLYTAVTGLVARLARRSRKRKTRLLKTYTTCRRGNRPQGHSSPAPVGVAAD